ncbi:MAG: hypothetical protein ACYC5A_08590 [Thermoleophilia bacterium]
MNGGRTEARQVSNGPRRRADRPSWHSRAVVLLAVMLALDTLILVLYLLTLDYPDESVTRLFHVDVEKNVPSTFSAIKLLLAGLAALACIGPDEGRRFVRMTYRDVWIILAVVLFLMGADEYFSYHEGFGDIFYRLKIITDEIPLGGYAWPWTMIGGALAAVVGAFGGYSTYRMFAGRRYLFFLLVLAGALFVTGSVGLENYGVYLDNFHASAGANTMMGVEELLEMASVSLAIFVFLRYREERLAED